MTELAVSVGQLARFCHRSGDIDYRFGPSPTGEQGVEGHQRVGLQLQQTGDVVVLRAEIGLNPRPGVENKREMHGQLRG